MTTQGEPPDAVALDLFWTVVNAGLTDALWTAFGFKGCPKHGRLINRLRPERRLLEETFLVREFWLVTLVEITKSIYRIAGARLGESLVARTVELLVDGPPETGRPGWNLLQFGSRQECEGFFITGLSSYLSEDQDKGASVFVGRFRSAGGDVSIPGFLSGAILMFTRQIPQLRAATDNSVASVAISQETRVVDPRFLRAVADATCTLR